jgi:2-C-methyl-D-erythritol 4-phosphate cytidylyltransferase
MPVALVIPAAGSGSRFGGGTPKQFLSLAGRAVLLRCLDAFATLVDEAVLPVNPAGRDAVAALIAGNKPPFPVRLCDGGTTRQASVHAGLLATHASCDLVLIHDAVRPLVPRRCIKACLAALADHDGAVVAVPCAPTVKRSDDGRSVAVTVPRDGLWLAQTPQGGRRAALLDAFAQAAAGNWDCSDDAQVLERAGHRVALVQGDARNLKITTPDDMALAEALLAQMTDPEGGGR